MKFDMSTGDNYASFVDSDSGIAVFVDSFDNREFDVRIGSIEDSEFAGKIIAETDQELNQKLEEIFLKFQGVK